MRHKIENAPFAANRARQHAFCGMTMFSRPKNPQVAGTLGTFTYVWYLLDVFGEPLPALNSE